MAIKHADQLKPGDEIRRHGRIATVETVGQWGIYVTLTFDYGGGDIVPANTEFEVFERGQPVVIVQKREDKG